MHRLSLILILFVFSILSCSKDAKKGDSSTSKEHVQYLPEGVERSEHRIFRPTGENFQGERIEPPFWWTGMATDSFELMIYDKDIANDNITLDYPGVTIRDIHRVANPNYLFLSLAFSPEAMPGTLSFERSRGGENQKNYSWELRSRSFAPGRVDRVDATDLMYLIMPDRFANGDPGNDSFEDMRQTGIERKKVYFRHGGDLQGIIDRLSYLQDLGITALWLNPVVENDQPYSSYHGYASTDYYNVDKRYGGNEKYRELADSLQARKMKLVMDIVPNHCGDYHWFIQDIPDSNWIHQFDSFTRSNHSKVSLIDPYAIEEDIRGMNEGWFDYSMPDLNQQHPRLSRYLIQNQIWWIEYAGLDALRIDTYPYADLQWMAKMTQAVLAVYPDFLLFGETWVNDPAILAPFAGGNTFLGFDTHQPGMMDFPLCFALHKALSEETTWTGGVYNIVEVLSQDYLYPNPLNNVTFLDNHDMSRIFSIVGEDLEKMKSAITLLLTLRGIPCLYYGTEILMPGFSDPDGLVRKDFKGGWPSDLENKFALEGRTYDETAMINHVRKLANLRKEEPGLFTGKYMQYAVNGEERLLKYARELDSSRLVVIFNPGEKKKKLLAPQSSTGNENSSSARDVIAGEDINLRDSLTVLPGSSRVILIKNQ